MSPLHKSVAIFLLTAAVTHAEWKDSITDYRAPIGPPFTPEKLLYKMSWNGAINSGKLTLEFGKSDPRYPDVFISHAYGRSTGPAYALFPYSFTFTSFSKLTNHRPLVFTAEENDNKETVDTKNSYKSPGIHHSSTTTLKSSKKVITKNHSFAARSIHDPITAMLAIRNFPLKNGSVVDLCCHPFASPYLIKVSVLGRERHLKYDCIKLDIQIQKIDKSSGKLKSYKKLKKATMWISDDSQRIPIELRSKVFIGDIRATLTERKPL